MGKRAFRLLMILLPFTNIIANRLDETIGIYILLGLFAVSFVFSSSYKMKTRNEKRMMTLCVISALVVVLYAIISLSLGINNTYDIRFFGLFILLLPFLAKKNGISFYHHYLPGYLKYLITLITVSIIIDTILMMMGLLTMQPMFDPEKYSYINRPFGLFGQPSVNSTLLCFFYIFYNSLDINKRREKDYLFVIVTIGILMQRSGSGFISYFFVLLLKYGMPNRNMIQKVSKKLIYLSLLLLVVFVWIVLSNKVEKISLNYMLELAEFSNEELWLPYLASLKNPAYLYFGIPETDLSIDLGPLFIIARVGLLFFIFLTIIFLYLFKNAKQVSMKLAIIMLLIGNLHYPVMFYFVMNFIWFFIVYHILVVKYEKGYSSCNVNLQPQPIISEGTN